MSGAVHQSPALSNTVWHALPDKVPQFAFVHPLCGLGYFDSSPLNTDGTDSFTSLTPHEIRIPLRERVGLTLFNTIILTPSAVTARQRHSIHVFG